MALFGVKPNYAAFYTFKDLRIYSLKMWDSSDHAVLNMIPCINPSGGIGMYDAVGKRFYQNANTSTSSANKFTAGPAV